MKTHLFYRAVLVFLVGTLAGSCAYADTLVPSDSVLPIPAGAPATIGHVVTTKAPLPSLPPSAAAALKNNATCPPRGDLEQWGKAHVGGVVGRVSDNADPNVALSGVKVTIPELNVSATTCADGSFYFPYDSK